MVVIPLCTEDTKIFTNEQNWQYLSPGENVYVYHATMANFPLIYRFLDPINDMTSSLKMFVMALCLSLTPYSRRILWPYKSLRIMMM